MKYISKVLTIIGVLVCMGFIACGTEENADGNARRHAYSLLHVARSKEGVFYIGSDDLVHFSSAETGDDTIICFNAACEHEPASSANPDPVCRAALFAETTQIAYYEGDLYYFVNDGAFDSKIYRMNMSGGTRELVAELPFGYMITYGVVFDEDYVYYTAKFSEIVENSITLENYRELVEVNLKDGSYRVLTSGAKENSYTITDFDVYGRTLYAEVSTKEEYYGIVINLETLDVKVEAEGEEYLERAYAGAYDEESYYYYNNYTGEIGIYNITNDKSKVLIATDTTYPAVWAYDHEIYYKTWVDDDVSFYFYDVNEGESTDITDKCNEYNIKYYDGYSDIFIGNVYGTAIGSANGLVTGYRVFSREDIVGG